MSQTVWRGSIPVAETSGNWTTPPVVLIVASDTGLREASARVLTAAGYTVMTASHAGHAMLACITAGHVDVLAADLWMEDLSGPALAARLRRDCPDMATVYFAGAGTPECEGVLVQPFTREDLIAAVALSSAAVAV